MVTNTPFICNFDFVLYIYSKLTEIFGVVLHICTCKVNSVLPPIKVDMCQQAVCLLCMCEIDFSLNEIEMFIN